MSRPKFASRKKVDLEDQPESARPARSAGADSVVTIDSNGAVKAVKGGVSALVKIILAIVTIVVVLYVALAATLMAAIPGDTGLTWVARNTFAGGRPDPGQFVYASSEEVKTGAANNILQAAGIGIEDAMVLETVAGPHVDISTDGDGQILANGEGTGYYGEVESGRIHNAYVMGCIVGACENGSFLILPQENIVGEAKGGLSTEGVGSYDSIRR